MEWSKVSKRYMLPRRRRCRQFSPPLWRCSASPWSRSRSQRKAFSSRCLTSLIRVVLSKRFCSSCRVSLLSKVRPAITSGSRQLSTASSSLIISNPISTRRCSPRELIRCTSSRIRATNNLKFFVTSCQWFKERTPIKISSSKNSNLCKITLGLYFKTHWWPKLRWQSRNNSKLPQRARSLAKSPKRHQRKDKVRTSTLGIRARQQVLRPTTKAIIMATILCCRPYWDQLGRNLRHLSQDCWRHLVLGLSQRRSQRWVPASWDKAPSATAQATPSCRRPRWTQNCSKRTPRPSWPNR